MSSPDRERAVVVGGNSYRLYYGNRSIRLLEKTLGKPFEEFNGNSVNEITTAVWCGFQQFHPGMTMEEVDDIIDEVGYVKMADICGEAIAAAFPSKEETAQGNEVGASAPSNNGQISLAEPSPQDSATTNSGD